MMKANFLHIVHPDVEKAQNDVDYLYQVIKVIHGFFPRGYIELNTLVFRLYGARHGKTMERLRAAGVDVDTPIVMKWDAEGTAVLLNKVLFPLAFIARGSENLSIAKYDKAYTRFILHQEEVS